MPVVPTAVRSFVHERRVSGSRGINLDGSDGRKATVMEDASLRNERETFPKRKPFEN